MKNPHAVALGRKGGKASTEAKRDAARANVAKARAARIQHTCSPGDRAERQYDANCARCAQIVARQKGSGSS